MTAYSTGTDEAQNIGNIVQFQGYSWFAYRENRLTSKNLWVARSADLKSWERTKMDDMPIDIDPHTDNRPQLVVIGADMYLLWMDSKKDALLATKYAMKGAAYAWHPYVNCQNASGAAIKERGDNASAALGAVMSGGQILVSVDYGVSLNTFIFDPATWGSGWRARSEARVPVSEWRPLLSGLSTFGRNQSIALFSLGAERTYLVQAVQATDTSTRERWMVAVFQLKNELTYWGPHGASTPSLAWFAAGAEQLTLTLDPGGRVLATYTRAGKAYTSALATGTVQATAWSAEKPLAAPFAVGDYPVTTFTFGGEAWGMTAANKPFQDRTVTRWSLLRHKDGDETSAVDDAAGVVRKIYRAEELNLTRSSTSHTLYVQGYIDGPPPVFDGMVNPASVVTYAVTSSVAQSNEVATNITTAIKTEGSTAPLVGAGAKWEASFSMTAGASFGMERTKSINMDTPFQLQVGLDGKYLNKGLVRGSDIILCRDAYEYLPDGVTPVLDGPVTTSIYVAFQPDTKFEYTLGTVTLGALESYTEAAWNERMGKLPRYAGKNYIQDIVKPKAVVFDTGHPTLIDTWTPGSPVRETFASTTSQYLAASFTLDTEVFAGVEGDFFGANASFMTGFQATIATTAKSVTSSGFGVSVSIDGSAGGPVARYRVATYLLKASQDWTYELSTFQSGQSGNYRIDQAGSCWKIMYVVDEILYDDALEALKLPAGRLAELKGKGLLTTQDLLRSIGLTYPADLHGTFRGDDGGQNEDILEALRGWDRRRNVYPEAVAEAAS
jgi:hypothetical protein